MATPGLFKVKVFWNKGYYVIYSVYDVTNKILSNDSNYIVDVVTWPKFEGWSWFKFNNLGLGLGTNLKFYTSLSKGLKLKVRKFWGLVVVWGFVEVTGEKLVRGAFLPPPSWIGLIMNIGNLDWKGSLGVKFKFSAELCLKLTTQKMKFSIKKDFFSKCDQIRNFLRIWLHLLK